MLDDHKIIVDTLYLSNLCSFMKTDSQKADYSKTVNALIAEKTLVVHCPLIEGGQKLHQSCHFQPTDDQLFILI